MIATFIGGDVDGDISDVDMEVDGDAGIGFQFFSLKNTVGFFAVFGWSGLACVDAGLSLAATLLISTICGVAMMMLMALLFWSLMRMTSSGTLNLKNAIGKVGEAYLIIPGTRGGFGKVQITVQGSLRELDALTDDAQSIPTGTIVKVLDIIDQHILLVTKSAK
jgi:membrane protein implicated in regulation of membrane protease activity